MVEQATLLGAVAAALGVLGSALLWLRLARSQRSRSRGAPARVRCLVVLGSGGHTAEMLYDLASLPWRERFDAAYLVADTDRGSQAKAEAFEAQRGGRARVVRVPRAREVGQGYLSSVPSTLRAAWSSLRAVLAEAPDLVLANGPGTCVPVVLAARLARALGLGRGLVVYSESFACVEHLSLSGKLCRPLADLLTVQWPELLARCPDAVYAGRLPLDGSAGAPALPQPEGGLCVVTVGSTRFEALVQAVDCPEFPRALRRLGITRLKIQRGDGLHWPFAGGTPAELDALEVVDYSPRLPEELRGAALVIAHAGAGTILDCLQAGRRLVVVPNEQLMNNHQLQLARALVERRLLLCAPASGLVPLLGEADFGKLRRFPEGCSPTLARGVCALLGLEAPG